jgi:hypothetical protein
MKTRICTLAVSAVALLSVPLAGAAIPSDSRSGLDAVDRHPLVIKQTAKKVKKMKKVNTHITVGHYNPYAYVPGSSSPSVAKAITAQGKRPR